MIAHIDEDSVDFWRDLAMKRDRQNIEQAATIARLEAENARKAELLKEVLPSLAIVSQRNFIVRIHAALRAG